MGRGRPRSQIEVNQHQGVVGAAHSRATWAPVSLGQKRPTDVSRNRRGRLPALPSISPKLSLGRPPIAPESVVTVKGQALRLQQVLELRIRVDHLKANTRNGFSMQSGSGRNAGRAGYANSLWKRRNERPRMVTSGDAMRGRGRSQGWGASERLPEKIGSRSRRAQGRHLVGGRLFWADMARSLPRN